MPDVSSPGHAIAQPSERPDASDNELGSSIRRTRIQRRLSLEELARRSGLSRSGLSKIERGEAAPSTTTLSKIAEALGTSFAELVSHPAKGEIVVLRHADQPTMVDATTGFVRRCIAPILPSRGLDWVLNTLPAGRSTGAFVPHRSGVEEYIYVLAGELTARLGERTIALAPGDALYFQAQVPHEFVAGPASACSYLLIIDSRR